MNFLDVCRLNQVPNRHVLLSDVPDGHLPGKCRHYGHKVIVCGEQAPFDKAVHYYPDPMLDAGFPSDWMDAVVAYIPNDDLNSTTDQVRAIARILRLGGEAILFVSVDIAPFYEMELANLGFQDVRMWEAGEGGVWVIEGTKVSDPNPTVTIPHTVQGAYCAVAHMRDYFGPKPPRVHVGEFGKSPWFLTEWLSAVPHITYAGVNRSVSCDSDLWRDYLKDGLIEENVLGCDWFFGPGPATEPDSSFHVFQSVNQRRELKRFQNSLGSWVFCVLPNRLQGEEDLDKLDDLGELAERIPDTTRVIVASRQRIKDVPNHVMDWTGGDWNFDKLYAMIRGATAYVEFGTGHGVWASHEGVPMFDVECVDDMLEGIQEICGERA